MSRKLTLAHAKAQFTNRFTMEHVPDWAFKAVREGRVLKFYAPQYRSDQEWYDNTIFPGEPGHDGSRHFCQSNKASWPLGQWLDKPYSLSRVAA